MLETNKCQCKVHQFLTSDSFVNLLRCSWAFGYINYMLLITLSTPSLRILTIQGLGGSNRPPPPPPPPSTFFTVLLNCFSVDNGTLWLFIDIIKKHCDSKNFSLYPMGVTWRHHFGQQLDGAKICKFQLFMLWAYLRNKQVYFEIIACKTKTIINVWLLIISGNDYVIMTSSG